MKKVFVIVAMIAAVASCSKDDNNGSGNNNNGGNTNLADGQILFKGEVYNALPPESFHDCEGYVAAPVDLWKYRRVFQNITDTTHKINVRITLSSHPPVGNRTYHAIKDNGIIGTYIASNSRAFIEIEDYGVSNRPTFYSDSTTVNVERVSGSITVTNDASDNVTYNFSDVKLWVSGPPVSAEMALVSGKNVLCQ